LIGISNAQILGTLIKEPKIVKIQNKNKTIYAANITVAVNHKTKNNKKESSYFNAVLYTTEKGSTFIQKNFKKSDIIYIEGTLKEEKWKSKNEKIKRKTVIKIKKILNISNLAIKNNKEDHKHEQEIEIVDETENILF
jgi:single-stranded DNA-binding protein